MASGKTRAPAPAGVSPRRPRGWIALAVGLLILVLVALPVSRWQQARHEAARVSGAVRPEIVALQQEIRERGYRWEAGPTGISDLTPAEFERMLGARVPADEPPPVVTLTAGATTSPAGLPARWDWRTMEGTTPARLQGVCGSCWAFAAAGVLEALLRIYDGREVDLSEQHVLDCNREGYDCSGGWMTGAYRLWQTDGARLEADQPYLGQDGRPCSPGATPATVFVRGWTGVAADRESVKQALLIGPVASAMHVYPDFQHYRSGVYEHEGIDPINHAVLLVGWDDSLGVWIVKNSWGRNWGENGCAYVAYDACRLGTYVHRLDVPAASPLALHHVAIADTVAGDVPLALRAVAGSLDASVGADAVSAWIDAGDGFFTAPMTRLGGDGHAGTYEIVLPPLRVGTRVRYAFEARDTDGHEAALPAAGTAEPFAFRVLRRALRDEMESPGAWEIGAVDDDATAGVWAWGEPEGTFGVLNRPAQPGGDLSPGVHACFATGLAAGADAGANDVDGGATTLLSPALDLSGLDDATARFRLWFSNQLGGYPWEDAFSVYGSADDGASWALLYETRLGAVGWRRVTLPLHEFLPLGGAWRLAFVVADRGGDSVVEAAIDDLEILTATPIAPDPDTPETPDSTAAQLRFSANPSRGPLELRITAGEAGPTTVGIYDATGRRVRSLWRGEMPAGSRTIVWDGCDDAGRTLGSGRFWARITTPRTTVTRAITRVR